MSREDDIRRRLRAVTTELPMGVMQISAEQGQLLALLARSLGARRVIEVGVFTGYSALCVAAALPADGLLVACDLSDEWTSVARPFWKEAGVDERIDLRLGEASQTLAKMIDSKEEGSFDMAFIDADKINYSNYYEAILPMIRPGGLIAVDNVLWSGRVLNPQDESDRAIHQFNERVVKDQRVESVLLTVRDGLNCIIKNAS